MYTLHTLSDEQVFPKIRFTHMHLEIIFLRTLHFVLYDAMQPHYPLIFPIISTLFLMSDKDLL